MAHHLWLEQTPDPQCAHVSMSSHESFLETFLAVKGLDGKECNLGFVHSAQLLSSDTVWGSDRGAVPRTGFSAQCGFGQAHPVGPCAATWYFYPSRSRVHVFCTGVTVPAHLVAQMQATSCLVLQSESGFGFPGAGKHSEKMGEDRWS